MKDAIKSKQEKARSKLLQEQEYLEQCRADFLGDVARKKKKRQEMREYLRLLKREANQKSKQALIEKELELQTERNILRAIEGKNTSMHFFTTG